MSPPDGGLLGLKVKHVRYNSSARLVLSQLAMRAADFGRTLYTSLFPKRLRMFIYRWRHPDFRLQETLSEICRDGIESFFDSLAQQKVITGNALEVGAGGRTQNSTRFASSAEHYWRTDIRKWPEGSLELICDCTMCPFADRSLDAVICSEVLEHVPDSKAALTEFGRILKPQGWLALTVPFFYPLHGVDGQDRGDYWRFAPGNLKLLLQRNFELVSEDRTHLFSKDDSFVVNIQMLWKRREPGAASLQAAVGPTKILHS